MARYGSTGEFSPALTSVTVAASPVNSNAINAEAADDARVYVVVTTVPGGATLDVDIMISHDGTTYARVASMTQITATGNYVYPLEKHQLGKYVRLKYTAAVGTIVFGATLEKKTGV